MNWIKQINNKVEERWIIHLMNSNAIYSEIIFSWNFCCMADFDLQLDNDGAYSMATIFFISAFR